MKNSSFIVWDKKKDYPKIILWLPSRDLLNSVLLSLPLNCMPSRWDL